MWTSVNLDQWCKQQADEIRSIGLKADTSGVSKLLVERVLIPNKVSLKNLLKPKLRIK